MHGVEFRSEVVYRVGWGKTPHGVARSVAGSPRLGCFKALTISYLGVGKNMFATLDQNL
jgi:hypothetical protein